MASARQATRPILQSLHRPEKAIYRLPVRALSTTPPKPAEVESNESTTLSPEQPLPPPSSRNQPARTLRQAIVGSKRRRVALATLGKASIPFEQLPYQCFQEARKVLIADREEKVNLIQRTREKIQRLEATDVAEKGSSVEEKKKLEFNKVIQLSSLRKYLEELKVLADVNDPGVKKRFEDGLGDLNKPIYRYLADRKWRLYRRKLVLQRITQMSVIPDVLPEIDLVADVTMKFGRRKVHPGDWVPSVTSEEPLQINAQVFDHGERLVTIAVVDPDVPDLAKDSFTSRVHAIYANIPISPTDGDVALGKLEKKKEIMSWLPPFAQKGSPYHRISVFVLQNPDNKPISVETAKKQFSKREGFSLRNFVAKFRLHPVGATMFRCAWDEGTKEVMERNGIEGADVQYKVKRIPKLPYKKPKGERFR
ncbi:PEBP-like protein [Aulographum hederae CBS 113979]|uniref:Large ribosomal subunit protein mL38 n=1 Tax=Aulographum hederae CBS 113979 TaxID=1176131 RepID=A0A6G1H096_9PEZI|nr:PEBP-like protein [Aulographum hederae CBS 113979]